MNMGVTTEDYDSLQYTLVYVTGALVNASTNVGEPVPPSWMSCLNPGGGPPRQPENGSAIPVQPPVTMTVEEALFLGDIRYYLGALATFCVAVLGIIGNLLALLTLGRRRHKDTTDYYLIALAVSDALVLLTVTAIVGHTLPQIPGSEAGMNTKANPVLYVYLFPYVHSCCIIFQVISVWLTLAFTIDRYLKICHPYWAARVCSNRKTKRIVVCLFLGGFVYGVPRFFEYTARLIPACPPIRNQSMLVIDLTEFGLSDAFRNVIHFGCYFLCQCGLPLIALGVFNALLVREIRAIVRRGAIGPHWARSTSGASMKSTKSHEHSQEHQHLLETTIMLIGVVIVFLICQVPALCSRILWSVDVQLAMRSFGGNILNEVGNFLIVLNSAVNVLVYYAMSANFRRELKRTLREPCGCGETGCNSTATSGLNAGDGFRAAGGGGGVRSRAQSAHAHAIGEHWQQPAKRRHTDFPQLTGTLLMGTWTPESSEKHSKSTAVLEQPTQEIQTLL